MAKDRDFNENSYVKVNERLKKFRDEFPEGFIHTIRTGEEGGIYFTCLIFRNREEAELYSTSKIAPATGHAYLPDEARADDKVEEFCETVSIGRALACLGYDVEKSIASKEEMEQFDRIRGENVEDEDLDEEEDEKPKRRVARRKKKATREASEDSDEDGDDEEESPAPKLKTTRKVRRRSKLSTKKGRK